MPIRVAAALNAATTDVVQRPTPSSAPLCGPVLSPNAADDEKEHEHHSEHAPPDDSFDEVVLGRRLGGWAVAARRRGRERRRGRVLASCPVVAACAWVQITRCGPNCRLRTARRTSWCGRHRSFGHPRCSCSPRAGAWWVGATVETGVWAVSTEGEGGRVRAAGHDLGQSLARRP